jgi:hypothetical protein
VIVQRKEYSYSLLRKKTWEKVSVVVYIIFDSHPLCGLPALRNKCSATLIISDSYFSTPDHECMHPDGSGCPAAGLGC